jgi:hypothetical protein
MKTKTPELKKSNLEVTHTIIEDLDHNPDKVVAAVISDEIIINEDILNESTLDRGTGKSGNSKSHKQSQE